MIFELECLVEDQTAEQTKNEGGILFYDWTVMRIHFVAVYASYCVQVRNITKSRDMISKMLHIVILDVSPMSKIIDS